MAIQAVTLSAMQTQRHFNPWALWAKRFVLVSLVALLAYVGGSGSLLVFNLEWQLEPFRIAVFSLGAATHIAVVVLLSEGKRTGQGWLVGLAIVAMLFAAAMDGRFACEHILRGEGATVEASVSADVFQADADRLQSELADREHELAKLREQTEIMDHDGDSENDGQVKANRALFPQLETQVADRRRELADARRQVREARVGAAGTAHSRSTTLQLADGLSEKTKIVVFWSVGSVLMVLLGAVIASATWTLGIMSNPENALPTVQPDRWPTVSPSSAIPPDGGQPNGKPSHPPLNGFAEMAPNKAPADRQKGLRFRNDGRHKRAIHERRIRGMLHTIPLPAGATPEELEQTAAAVNRMVDAALAQEPTANLVPFQKVG